MEKLTIDHLAPYLPFQVKVQVIREDESIDYITLTASQAMLIEDDYHFEPKLCLKPLPALKDPVSLDMPNTDLLVQIEISEFANKQISLSSLSYGAFQDLVRDHFDVFGLIDSGLAVDVNSLNKQVGL